MKIKELTLRNFKSFGPEGKTLKFCDAWGVMNGVTLLVGANGAGKSTVLQAIALLVGCASKKKLTPMAFNSLWPGFNLEHIGFNGNMPEAAAWMVFEQDEIEATYSFCAALRAGNPALQLPSRNQDVAINLHYPSMYYPEEAVVRSTTPEQLFQLRGYEYALQLNGGESTLADNLERVGSIYWFHDQRQANSIARAVESEQFSHRAQVEENMLRQVLQNWTAFHDRRLRSDIKLRPGQIDRYEKLDTLYQSVFPGRRLAGSLPHPSPDRQLDPPLFFFQDEQGNQYELSNMSAGERAIFPVLMDFATWVMNNSIILIDEIELHLHPPLQQALLRVLPKLGQNNQFIITTHSDHVVSMVPDANIICLDHE